MLNIDNSKILIIIVDDEMINLRIIESMLKLENYKTILIQDPLQVMEKTKSEKPDAILLDITMPGKSGYEICRELKADPETQKIPVIMLSGLNTSESVIKGLESGAQDYIVKPFNAPELLARVKTHIQLKITVEQLIEMEQLKALHAAMVSQNHTLNQLTTSILGQIDIIRLLEDKKEINTDKYRTAVGAIEKAAIEMDDKIRKFSNLSKIRFTKYSGNTEMLDINSSNIEEE
ncbi:MAG TPA: response regulator [Clostridiales bacterium]|jgi:DNA-binding response OmpR family regulator|nr:response regulator [Clostridiales bacterium]HQP68979.1 response regulator [Clostridiales bacterium]